MDFFTKEDLQLIKKWANKPYDHLDEIHQSIGEELKNKPWTKTKYWCQEVAKKVDLKDEVYLMWLTQGQKFKPYTWAKLYDDESWTKEIFFTVGINEGDKTPFFHIKIDYQFESPKELTTEQSALCRNLTRNKGDYKYQKRIGASAIKEYDWPRLIKETVEFIEANLDTYYDIVEKVGSLSLNTISRNRKELSDSTRNRSNNRTSTGRRTVGTYQIKRTHDEISRRLEDYLNQHKEQGESVKSERLLGRKAIDLVYEKTEKIVYYEIKTYRKLNYCVREGLGQLLEYAFWNTEELDRKLELVLVSEHSPTEVLEEFITKLQEEFGLPLHYQQFDLDENKLGELI